MSGQFLAAGTDFEVFLQDKTSGEIVSAIGVLEGDKEKKQIIDGYGIHHDNVLAEVSCPPAYEKSEFNKTVRHGLSLLSTIVEGKGLTYSIIDNYVMDEKYLRHYAAKEFGCEPDLDVFRNGISTIPASAVEAGNLRVAGGHVHISYIPDAKDVYLDTVLAVSAVLGLGTTLMGDTPVRRKLYGQAGKFRKKPYGFEIRTPSNVWLRYDQWINWIWSSANRAVVGSSSIAHKINREGKLRSSIVQTINDCDRDMAAKHLLGLGINLPASEDAIKKQEALHESMKRSMPEFIYDNDSFWTTTAAPNPFKAIEPVPELDDNAEGEF